MSEVVVYDPDQTHVEVVNRSGVGVGRVLDAVAGDPQATGALQPVYDALVQWHRRSTHRPWSSRRGGILDRDKYLRPETYSEQVRVAREALHDDVVGNAADGTEALAISGGSVTADDESEEDVWNQIMADCDLDGTLRKAWRSLFTDSAYTIGVWYGRRSYKPRMKGAGGRALRTERFENITVPIGFTFLDTRKIIPVGHLHFGQEQLCYMADPLEALQWDALLAKREEARSTLPAPLPESEEWFVGEDLVSRFAVRRYRPNLWETQELLDDGVEDVSDLFLLNPRTCYRHTLTRPDYRRFPDVRLASLFPLLDLKNALHQMERAHLLGAASYIVLITKGTDQHPVEDQRELDNLRANVATLAQLPIVVGDHRLSIEIITPKLDVTLKSDRHDTLDARLFARAWGTFVPTGQDQDDPLKLGKVIGRSLESRRKMMRRSFEARVFDLTRFANPQAFTGRAKLRLSPATIALQFDPNLLSFMTDARESGDLSRHTYLATFDQNQEDEARYLEREKKRYDSVFPTVINPYGRGPDNQGDDGPPEPTGVARRRGGRRRGGRRNGGGAAPGTNQGGRIENNQIGHRGRRQRAERLADLLLDLLDGDVELDEPAGDGDGGGDT